MDDPDSPRAMPATPVACRPVAPTSASGTSENGSFKSCGSKAGPRRHPIRSSSTMAFAKDVCRQSPTALDESYEIKPSSEKEQSRLVGLSRRGRC